MLKHATRKDTDNWHDKITPETWLALAVASRACWLHISGKGYGLLPASIPRRRNDVFRFNRRFHNSVFCLSGLLTPMTLPTPYFLRNYRTLQPGPAGQSASTFSNADNYAMNILFIHQNFPGQFKHLAPALARRGHNVVAMTMQKPGATTWQGVTLVPYSPGRGSTPGIHPWIIDFETKTIRAEACFRAALHIKTAGFYPDIIIAHHGWGESLFVKEIWPKAKLGIYCEFFYHAHGTDVDFDPEFALHDPGEPCRQRLKNLNNILHFDIADAGISLCHEKIYRTGLSTCHQIAVSIF